VRGVSEVVGEGGGGDDVLAPARRERSRSARYGWCCLSSASRTASTDGQPSSWFLGHWISGAAAGTSLSPAPHLPEPEPGQHPPGQRCPYSRTFLADGRRDMPSALAASSSTSSCADLKCSTSDNPQLIRM